MTTRRFVAALFTGACLVPGSACGITGDDQPTFEAAQDVPFELLGTTPPGTSPTSTVPRGVSVRICLLGADELIHPVDRSLPPDYQPAELVETLTAGPTDAERSFGLTTALAEPGTVTEIDVQAGVATIDLDPALDARPVTDQLTVVTQLVCTLTGQPGIGQVRFTVEQRPIPVPRGDGSSTSDPVSREDYDTLITAP